MNYLSAQIVAERLVISIKTVRRYIKNGKLPSIKIGKLRRISEADLEKFIDDRKERDEAETAYHRRRNELLEEAAQVVADWQSKRKKLWIEERTVPVMSMGRK
jgi:excisionase family DNA binding protein